MTYRPPPRGAGTDYSRHYASYHPTPTTTPAFIPINHPLGANAHRVAAGGGRLHPTMARGSSPVYSTSYPPRSATPRELIPNRERNFRGYNPNPYGDFPPSRSSRASSAPRLDDPGYGRLPGYPSGSRMDREYNSYKAKDVAAGQATKAYTAQATRLAVPNKAPNGRSYGAVKGKYFYPEDHVALLSPVGRAVEATKAYVYSFFL